MQAFVPKCCDPSSAGQIPTSASRKINVCMNSMIEGRQDGYFQHVRELQAEFRHGNVEALADRIVASEAADFYWEARLMERYLCRGRPGGL